MLNTLLSIVTPVHDNLSGIKNIYHDLCQLICCNNGLIWIIKDSGSSTEIIKWHKAVNKSNIILISNKDFGIYDAINLAIKHSPSKYYLVVGSDDRIYNKNINLLLSNLTDNKYRDFDMISFPVIVSGILRRRRRYIPLSWSISSLISSHSCGLIIKKSLHDKIGYYSLDYAILSDSLLILKFHYLGLNIYYENFPIGIFNADGISSSLSFKRAIESYKYQVECGSSKYLQLIYYSIRIFYLKFKKIFPFK
jgi:glycosyltransferase involved in cell wall biosynthesis